MRALVIAILLAAAPARAEEDAPEKQQARLLLAQGNALFERGDLRAALADFRAAYALYPSPKLLINCAAAERELGDYAAAANDLRHYLDEVGDDDVTLVERAQNDLRGLERRVGKVQLAGWPARTTVELNGRAARDPAYVRAGERHRLRVRAPGGEVTEREVELAAGESVAVTMPVSIAGPGIPKARPPKKSRAWIAAVVVAGVLVVGGATAVGVVFGTQSSSQPLTGELGTYRFSEFH